MSNKRSALEVLSNVSKNSLSVEINSFSNFEILANLYLGFSLIFNI